MQSPKRDIRKSKERGEREGGSEREREREFELLNIENYTSDNIYRKKMDRLINYDQEFEKIERV